MVTLIPAVLGGFEQKAAPGALGEVISEAASMGQPDTEAGNHILVHTFGSKDVSRQVGGVSSSLMKAILPVIAAMVAKHVATNGGMASGGIKRIMGSLLGGTSSSGGLGGIGAIVGRSGSPLDAILGRGG